MVWVARKLWYTFAPSDRSVLINGIDPQQLQYYPSAGSKIEFNDGFLKDS
jgi:hypothetical protein